MRQTCLHAVRHVKANAGDELSSKGGVCLARKNYISAKFHLPSSLNCAGYDHIYSKFIIAPEYSKNSQRFIDQHSVICFRRLSIRIYSQSLQQRPLIV